MMKRLTLHLATALLLALPFTGNAQHSLYGDVNTDGEVNIADVNTLIGAILSEHFSTSLDVNNDGEVSIADVNAVIDKILNPDPVLESPGLYMGVTGFNRRVHTSDISLLDQRQKKEMLTQFVSSLGEDNVSVLYYAVDNSLDAIEAAPIPKNLGNVTLVTFTDGLDQRSLALTDKGYTSDTEYASALNARINGMTVNGIPLQAYSIGIQGSDVTNSELFMYNLRSLASSEDKIAIVEDMNEVEDKLREIAASLTKSSYSHTLTLTIPGMSNGMRIRITLEGESANTVAQAEKYLEGTYNLSDNSLGDVTYHGLTSTSGPKVMPRAVNGESVTYAFDNLVMDKPGERVNKNKIRLWCWAPENSEWQENNDYTPNINIDATSNSAIVMLVLDCSTKYGGDWYGGNFDKLKNAANEFINMLYNNEKFSPNDWVDLGLPSGTIWATHNIGANNPEDYGDYFAWGEVYTKDYYFWDNYEWGHGGYCWRYQWPLDPEEYYTDGLIELELGDDAAYVNWGASTRMPSSDQMMELINQCSWTWTTLNGVNGMLITGPNGNTIFFPAGGSHEYQFLWYEGESGHYWSRCLGEMEPESREAGCMNVSDNSRVYLKWCSTARCLGYSVRAVHDPISTVAP